MKRYSVAPIRYSTTPKRGKIPHTHKKQNSVSAYSWVVYSSSRSLYESY